MKKQTILDKVRDLVASLGFRMFLWGSQMTEDEYLNQVYYQEYNRIHKQAKEASNGI